MESQPQNPEFRIYPEKLSPMQSIPMYPKNGIRKGQHCIKQI